VYQLTVTGKFPYVAKEPHSVVLVP